MEQQASIDSEAKDKQYVARVLWSQLRMGPQVWDAPSYFKSSGVTMVRYACPKCSGTGRVMVFKEPTDRCYRCDGAKFLWMTKRAWDAKQDKRKAIQQAMEAAQ